MLNTYNKLYIQLANIITLTLPSHQLLATIATPVHKTSENQELLHKTLSLHYYTYIHHPINFNKPCHRALINNKHQSRSKHAIKSEGSFTPVLTIIEFLVPKITVYYLIHVYNTSITSKLLFFTTPGLTQIILLELISYFLPYFSLFYQKY